MNIIKLAGGVSILLLVAGCAQQEEAPTRITPEPVFDKYGGGSCEADYVYVPGTTARPPECIPEDECEPITTADGAQAWDCFPPPRQRDDSSSNDDNDRDRGRSPTGSVPGTAPRS